MENDQKWVTDFSFEEWLPKFELDSEHALCTSYLGPDHLCFTELLRRKAQVYHAEDLHHHVLSDVMVFGWGEGPNRDGTKVGGLPYLLKTDSWPQSKESGRSLDFICQLRFKESTDILGPLPGDILLVFCDMSTQWGDETEWYFQWADLGQPDSELVTIHDLPTEDRVKNSKVPTCYGVRVRYSDFACAGLVESILEALLDIPRFKESFEDETWTQILNSVRGWAAQMCCLKIGGIPHWERPVEALVQKKNMGQFLATIPPMYSPIDFLDDELLRASWINGKYLKSLDFDFLLPWYYEGSFHLFLNDENEVEARFASLTPW